MILYQSVVRFIKQMNLFKRAVCLAVFFMTAASAAASEAEVVYHSRYFLTGLLVRSSAACAYDKKGSVDVGFGLVSSPEYMAFTKAYPATIQRWMMEGTETFNTSVMHEGLPKACEEAYRVRAKAVQILSGQP